MDLMRGQVVRGVGGRREEYRPIESLLARDARPRTVAQALTEAGFREAYVADLDAIGGSQPAWSTFDELMTCGLELLVDAGLAGIERVGQFMEFAQRRAPLTGIVSGLESLDGPDALCQIVARVGPSRLIFSLDLKDGRPLAQSAWKDLSAVQIASLALRLGVRRMIVLDLASVGMNRGAGTEPLCRELRCLEGDLEIIAGGGVRGWDDLRSLEAAGCDAAVIASALHDGRLEASECAAWR